jgi:hypothetical protein
VETEAFLAFPEVPTMNALLIQAKALARIAMYLIAAFFALQLWQDPAGAAHATVEFIGGIGTFFADLIDKMGAFVKGLTE